MKAAGKSERVARRAISSSLHSVNFCSASFSLFSLSRMVDWSTCGGKKRSEPRQSSHDATQRSRSAPRVAPLQGHRLQLCDPVSARAYLARVLLLLLLQVSNLAPGARRKNH